MQPCAAFTLPIIRESLSQSYAPGYGQLKDVPSIPVKHNKLTDLAAAPMLRPLWRKSRYQSSVIVPTRSRKVVDRLRIAQASLARGARGAQQFLQSGLLKVRDGLQRQVPVDFPSVHAAVGSDPETSLPTGF